MRIKEGKKVKVLVQKNGCFVGGHVWKGPKQGGAKAWLGAVVTALHFLVLLLVLLALLLLVECNTARGKKEIEVLNVILSLGLT